MMEVCFRHLFRHFGHCPKLSKMFKVIGFRKAKKVTEFLICQGWHIYCMRRKSESEPSRIPVVMSGLWR
mgnify:CR=1 FL=1